MTHIVEVTCTCSDLEHQLVREYFASPNDLLPRIESALRGEPEALEAWLRPVEGYEFRTL